MVGSGALKLQHLVCSPLKAQGGNVDTVAPEVLLLPLTSFGRSRERSIWTCIMALAAYEYQSNKDSLSLSLSLIFLGS